MSENNSIINSLKRLERVGEETSVVTMKLKEAVDEVANKIDKLIRPYAPKEIDYDQYDCTKIIGKLYYIMGQLAYDYDGNLGIENHDYFLLCPEERYVYRECALEFAKAVSSGLIDQVADWVEKKKVQSEKALKTIKEKVSPESEVEQARRFI